MDIKDSPAGKMIRSLEGYKAFLPNQLPPPLVWSPELVSSLSRADRIIGRLAGEGSKLPNPHLLMRPFIAREAVLSSRIEGTLATIGEVLASQAGIAGKGSPEDLQEVENYIVALDFGLKRLVDFPLSLRVIKEIHEKLMQGVRGAHATPGEFRRSQNWIGVPGSTLFNAKYVPPTPADLMQCLGDFELFLHDQSLPPLIHVALCHYQFEAIHPFLDGNGRVGRLLITLLLIERGILPSPLLYISAFFEATRAEYYRQLYNVSAQGSWEDWLIYFLNGVAMQSTDVLSRAERINGLIEKWSSAVAGISSSLPREIVRYLAVNPFVTTTKIATHFNSAFTTAQRAIQLLEKHNIVIQVSGTTRDRVYCAQDILAILEEPAMINEISREVT